VCSFRSIAIAMPVPSLPQSKRITSANPWESHTSQQFQRLV